MNRCRSEAFIAALVVWMILATPLCVRAADLPTGVSASKDISYAVQDGKPLLLDVYLPPNSAKQPCPVIVRLSPRRETPASPAGELLSRGYALIYAGYLPDDVGKFTAFSRFPKDLFAARAAVRFARGNAEKFHLDSNRVAIWGDGHGATIAALLAVTSDQKDLRGTLGDFAALDDSVQSVCLLGGTTDWRNAELYGDETVNHPGDPAYQLFGDNPKQVPDTARIASAINYVRPISPPVLMITLHSDSNRAMHLIFAETLRLAGVASALYEESTGAGLGGKAVDEAKLDRTILEFFDDTLRTPKNVQMTRAEEITALSKAGLYKQARRLIEEQLAAASPEQREFLLKQLGELAQQQQEPAIRKLMDVLKHSKESTSPASGGSRILWTIREVLTDPERIGHYDVEATIPQADFDARAAALRHGEILKGFIVQRDWGAANRHAAEMRRLADDARGGVDKPTIDGLLKRYAELRNAPDKQWPDDVKPVGFANAFGQDLYGFWMETRAGGVMQRFRYIPPGTFVMGSSKEEWGRLPGEPILEDVTIKNGFWLADSPVTQAMWEGVVGKDQNRSHFRGPNLPVENISYAHAVNFVERLGVDARLPTEAEWEYACRTGSRQMYSGTGRLSDMAWFWDEKQDTVARDNVRILHELETDLDTAQRSTHAVKTKLPNAWGLYDMHGNVWQWCSGTSAEKSKDYHPARGGSWISIPQSCRAARATWQSVEYQSWNLGMRILIPATPR